MARAHVSGAAAGRLTGLNHCTVMSLSGAVSEHTPPDTKKPAGR